ncbi:MAG: mycofactocin-associated electron transfer flavoprotein beta subunit [Acidimicrobiales bacterium]
MNDTLTSDPVGGTSAHPGRPRPAVVVCVRPTDPRPHVDPLTAAVSHDAAPWVLPAAEAAAVELGLRLGKHWSTRLFVVSLAGPEADDALGELVALGADVCRVETRASPDPDGPTTRVPGLGALVLDQRDQARALAAAIAGLGPVGVVLCGDRSPDRGTGELPAFLAHELGLPQALGLVRLDPADDGLVGLRRLDGGWREQLRIPTPAVCSVEGAGVVLRRASLAAVVATAGQAVPVVTVPVPAVPRRAGRVVTGPAVPFRPPTHVVPAPHEPDPRDRIARLTGVLVAHEPTQVVGPVDATEAADTLLAYLARHGMAPAPAPDGAAHPSS